MQTHEPRYAHYAVLTPSRAFRSTRQSAHARTTTITRDRQHEWCASIHRTSMHAQGRTSARRHERTHVARSARPNRCRHTRTDAGTMRTRASIPLRTLETTVCRLHTGPRTPLAPQTRACRSCCDRLLTHEMQRSRSPHIRAIRTANTLCYGAANSRSGCSCRTIRARDTATAESYL
jgi:hypothetical protein